MDILWLIEQKGRRSPNYCATTWSKLSGTFSTFGAAGPAALRSLPPSAAPRRASADLVAERYDAAICPESGEKRKRAAALETTLMTLAVL
jgi:hypothetical protein